MGDPVIGSGNSGSTNTASVESLEYAMAVAQAKAAGEKVAEEYDPSKRADDYGELANYELLAPPAVQSRGTQAARAFFEGARLNDVQSLDLTKAFIGAALAEDQSPEELLELAQALRSGTANPEKLQELIEALQRGESVDVGDLLGTLLPDFTGLTPQERQDFMVEFMRQYAAFESVAWRSDAYAAVGSDYPAKLANEALQKLEEFKNQFPPPTDEQIATKYAELFGEVMVGVAIARGLNSAGGHIVEKLAQEIEKLLREAGFV